MRGLVEGFYGKPYSKSQRDKLIRYLANVPGSAYMYAPKNDPHHRLRWREPYPAGEWDGLRSSMSLARSMGVRFIFGISPWAFTGNDAPVLRDRIDAAVEAGARGTAILFDDIPESADGDLARRQIRLARDALEGTEHRPIVCPSVYCCELIRLLDGDGYLDAWREEVPGDWPSLWTGDMVVSPEMDRASISTARRLLGSTPVIWDNLLADDYCLRRIYLADPSPRMLEGVDYFLNGSGIYPVTLHALYRMAAGCGRGEWPAELGTMRAWEILAAFHGTPWKAGENGSRLVAELEQALQGDTPDDLLRELDDSITVLGELIDNLGEMDGGFDLMPHAVDLKKFLWWWRKVLVLPDPQARMSELHRLADIRLPFEHPLASMTSRLIQRWALAREGSLNEG